MKSASLTMSEMSFDLQEAAQRNIHNDAESRTLYKLVALFVSHMINRESDPIKYRIANCVSLSTSRRTYGKCVWPLFEKRKKELQLSKLKTSNREKRAIIVEDRFLIKNEGRASRPMSRDFWPRALFADVGKALLDMIYNIKKTTESWFGFSIEKDNVSWSDDNPRTHMKDSINNIANFIKNFLKSPLTRLKPKFDVGYYQEDFFQEIQTLVENHNQSIRIFSPRLFPLYEKAQKDHISLFSPDLLALYDKSENSDTFSMGKILRNFSEEQKRPWLEFLKEISGANDALRLVKNLNFTNLMKKSRIDTGTGYSIPMSSTYNFSEDIKVYDVYKTMDNEQLNSLNSRGFTFMKSDQMKQFLGNGTTVDEHELELGMIEDIGRWLNVKKRYKRDVSPPCVLAPYLGGTTLSPYINAPQIICPSVFSYIVLGPLVLSPYVLSPYVLGPFILSPQVLTPFILSPYVLSPDVLSPFVLSPNIVNPTVLSPIILCPLVLSPSVLSPTVLSPTILSPGVLSPSVLSDSALGPSVLSPCRNALRCQNVLQFQLNQQRYWDFRGLRVFDHGAFNGRGHFTQKIILKTEIPEPGLKP
uniref:Uncharacterized protein n=1 Tax=Romanomermis culicivorax TaxID=13658 RepID=A0A915I0M7_ROMCU